MDTKELTIKFTKHQKEINEIWRSLWPRKQTKKTRIIE